MPHFRIELLGRCRIVDILSGKEIEFRTRKARCLLGLLALSPSASANRERLASLLWDPAPEELARGSLRQSLKEVRETLGATANAAIVADRFSVSLRAADFDVDALTLKALIVGGGLNTDDILKAAALWQGELFGAQLPQAPVFEAWVQVERSHLRSLLTKALTDQLEAKISAGDYADARIADELVRIEPSHELAHQYLMQFFAMRGDQAGALRQFNMLERSLSDELDSEPSEESNALLVAIKRGDVSLRRPGMTVPNAALVARTPRRGPPRITIRPPLTRHTDSSKDYLAEGFSYLIKSCLARFRCWVVAPWPSTGYDSAVAIDYTALGKAIDADFAVDCVLDWRGPAGKLFVTLIDCRDGSEIWSKIYPVGDHDLQEVSSSVAGAVTANLAAQVNYVSLLRHARSQPGDPVAYDLWLRGHQLSRLWTVAGDQEAERLFEKAISLDPGLACCHASLSQILCTRAFVRPGYSGRQADCAQAFGHAQTAIALDPYDSRCHISMAWNWLIAQSAERAKTHFRLAVDLNPADAETLIAAACGMARLGQLEDACGWAEIALKLNPIHPEYYSGYLATIHYLNGDYPAAIIAAEKCPDAFPDLAIWGAAAWARLGHAAQAARVFQAFRQLIAAMWEGGGGCTDAQLEAWLLDTIPFAWPEGRDSIAEGIRLARTMAGKPVLMQVSGSGA